MADSTDSYSSSGSNHDPEDRSEDQTDSSEAEEEVYEEQSDDESPNTSTSKKHGESGYLSHHRSSSVEPDDEDSDLNDSVRIQEEVDKRSKLKDCIPEALEVIKPLHEADLSSAIEVTNCMEYIRFLDHLISCLSIEPRNLRLHQKLDQTHIDIRTL